MLDLPREAKAARAKAVVIAPIASEDPGGRRARGAAPTVTPRRGRQPTPRTGRATSPPSFWTCSSQSRMQIPPTRRRTAAMRTGSEAEENTIGSQKLLGKTESALCPIRCKQNSEQAKRRARLVLQHTTPGPICGVKISGLLCRVWAKGEWSSILSTKH